GSGSGNVRSATRSMGGGQRGGVLADFYSCLTSTRGDLRFDSSIRSGSAPLFILACKTSSPLPHFSRVCRPLAIAASSTSLGMPPQLVMPHDLREAPPWSVFSCLALPASSTRTSPLKARIKSDCHFAGDAGDVLLARRANLAVRAISSRL